MTGDCYPAAAWSQSPGIQPADILAAFLEQQEDLLTLTSGAPYEIQAINRDPR